MQIISNRDLIWDIEKYDVILVGTSIYCMLSNGFQSKVKNKYPFIEEENNKTRYGDYRKLGTRLTLQQDNSPIISLLYICGYPNKNRVTVDYTSLETCLRTAEAEFRGKKIATTILGSSKFDGNGDKKKCQKLLDSIFDNIFVYDYTQLSKEDEIRINKQKIDLYKDVDYKKYCSLKKKENEILKGLYLK